MKETNREDVLSRLMDGEWDELDAGRCVAEVCESEELKAKWARYHMARDVMRGEVVNPTTSIAAGVFAALADEPSYTNVTTIGGSIGRDVEGINDVGASNAYETDLNAVAGAKDKASTNARSRWGMGAAGMGIAASAALATVLSLDYLRTQDTTSDAKAFVATTNTALPSAVQNLTASGNERAQVELVSNPGSYWVSGQDGHRVSADFRLNQLLGDHLENTSSDDWRGMIPYSRLLGYDSTTAVQVDVVGEVESAPEAAQ